MSQSQRTRLQPTAGSSTSTVPASSGSQTITATSSSGPSATLRLRAEPSPTPSRRIQWAEDVVDNEGMGKKSSKVCCIYHKPTEPGDSDSDSDCSSSSDSDSDNEPDLSRAHRAGSSGRRGRKGGEDAGGNGKGPERKPSPNAYERQPKHKGKKQEG